MNGRPDSPADGFEPVDDALPAKAHFDPALKAWVLSRHADVATVLQNPLACPASIKSDQPLQPGDDALSARLRSETLSTLSPEQLRLWQQEAAPELDRRLNALPERQAVDLLADYAQPVCLALAAVVTGISPTTAAVLTDAAGIISAAAANPYDESLRRAAKAAEPELAGHFHAELEMLRDSTFVALSQTMPCILGNAWYALAQHPEQWQLVHRQPELTERAVEELLRFAGLVRVLGRESSEDLELNGCTIPRNQRMVLRVTAANRDPDKFPEADRLDVTRRGGNLALGAGPHSCTGASLIRMAAAMLTRPLVERFGSATVVKPVEWKGGAAFRSPRELWVTLSR